MANTSSVGRLPAPGDDVWRRVDKRGATVFLVLFVARNLAVLIALVVIVAFDLPVEPVAWSMSTLLGVGAIVFAVIMGRRTR